MELLAPVAALFAAGWFFYWVNRVCSNGGGDLGPAPHAETRLPTTIEHGAEPAAVAPESPAPVLDAAPCEAPSRAQASADLPCAKVKTIPLGEADRLAELLDLDDYSELALAVRERRVPSLCAEDREIIGSYATRVRSFTPVAVDAEKLAEALVVVTTAGWGDKAETTLPGRAQPLMQLK